MEGPPVLLIVVLVAFAAAIVATVILAVTLTQRRADQAWAQAARVLALEFTPGSLKGHASLSGTVDGFGVEVETYTKSGDNTKRTRYRVFYSPLGLGLGMQRQGIWQRVSKVFGGQDIETGDPGFDIAVSVKGDDPARVAAFLTASRRLSAHRLISEFAGVTIDDAGIAWSHSGVERSAEKIVSTLRRFTGVAGQLAHAGSRPSIDRALQTQAEGNAGEAAALFAAAREEEETPESEQAFFEAAASYAAGRFEQADAALEEVERHLPADAQVSAWRNRAVVRASGIALPAPSDESAALDAASVSDDLFAPGRLSFDTTRRFEKRYEGRRIEWTGTVVRHSVVRSDLDFGRKPGTKAVIRVHRLGWDLYGGRDVDAVVWLPEYAAATLRGVRDAPVTFSGTLLRCDPLMRNLYVADGALE